MGSLPGPPPPAPRTGICLPGLSSCCCAVSVCQPGVAGEQRRGPVPILDPSGCARSCFWKVSARSVPFSSLCPSLHTGDGEGRHSGLNPGLSGSFGHQEEHGLWRQTDLRLHLGSPPNSREISAALFKLSEPHFTRL